MYYSVICIISVFEGYNIYNNTNNTYFIYTIYIIMVFFLVLEKKRKIYSLSMSNENNTFFCIISVLMVLTEF